MPTIEAIRAQFPALQSGFVYLENAGGSQVPMGVARAISDYMVANYVQLGASYEASVVATETVDQAHRFVNRFMNGEGVGEVVLGPSSSQLCAMLAECYSRKLAPGDEVVICETAHEANAGPWARLERFGMIVRTWKIDPTTFRCSLDSLASLLNKRTKIVAFPHVSNLLGEVVDVAAVTKLVHAAGARVVVDGVAYAPHRAIDVASWDVDFYGYSCYKVYGPHMAAMFAKHEAWAELDGPNHFFLPRGTYSFELGGVNHEGCAGLLALQDYLAFLACASPSPSSMGRGLGGGGVGLDRASIVRAWEVMAALETPLTERLCEYLSGSSIWRIVGPSAGNRVPTVSFCHQSLSPDEVVAEVDRAGIGIRFGNMYAYRLCEALDIDPDKGVVRASAVHYNTVEEIERLIGVLDAIPS